MDDLRNAMRVIDDNSDKLPEGDYLKLCNLLRNVYRREERKDMNTLVDYDTFNMYVPGQSDEVLDYFYDHYFQMSLENERLFLSSQKRYLESELEIHRPIMRISRKIKLDAIHHYCHLNNILLYEYTPEKFLEYTKLNEKDFKKEMKRICRGFIHMENAFRNLYRGVIMERLEKIEGWMEELDNM